jgi:hypothetical protein
MNNMAGEGKLRGSPGEKTKQAEAEVKVERRFDLLILSLNLPENLRTVSVTFKT